MGFYGMEHTLGWEPESIIIWTELSIEFQSAHQDYFEVLFAMKQTTIRSLNWSTFPLLINHQPTNKGSPKKNCKF